MLRTATHRAAGTTLLLAGLIPGLPVHADDKPWHYTIGEQHAGQQANLCDEGTDIAFLAKVFRDAGTRPGFSILQATPTCSARVETFTPQQIIENVAIETHQHGRFDVNFVRVRTLQGEAAYLVTTREVRAP